MSDGYGVDPQRLRAAGEGIDAVIAELGTLGLGVAARTGDNFGRLGTSGVELGHAGLSGAFSEFCGRWSWGVRELVREGSEFAQQLGLAAGAYHASEQYGVGVLSEVLESMRPPSGSESLGQAAEHIAATWLAEAADVVATRFPGVAG